MNNAPLIFSTNGLPAASERMRLTPFGSLGINTTNPLSMFHMSQGSFLLSGNLGVNPNPAAGTQFLWVPNQRSLRVGSEMLDEWDAPNVGLDTYAIGVGISLNGFSSFSAGSTNASNSGWGIILGTNNTVLAANHAHVVGRDNIVSNGAHGYVLGRANTSFGGESYQIGFSNTANNGNSWQMGNSNLSNAAAPDWAVGCLLQNNANFSTTFGLGDLATGTFLANNLAGSIMLGSGSNLPTLFMTQAAGIAAFGNVGIGIDPNTTLPSQTLDVGNNARFRNVNIGAGQGLVTAVHQTGVNDIVLSSLAYPTDATLYLDGTGNWSDPGGADCDWDTDGNHVWTGLASGCLPPSGVGIGTTSPTGKLSILNDANSSFANNAVNIRALSSANAARAISIRLSGASTPSPVGSGNYGVDIDVADSQFAFGVRARSDTPAGQQAIGVIGLSGSAQNLSVGIAGIAGSVNCGSRNIGVYGEANGPSCTFNAAGYFVGPIVSGPALAFSDATLKENIEPLPSQMEALMQLQPRSYIFSCDDYPELHLPQGEQCGLIAQELQEVFPEMVQTVFHPGKYDDDGIEISPGHELLAVDYEGLVPILIEVTQEQQTAIVELQAKLAEVMEIVDGCCDRARNADAGNGDGLGQGVEMINSPNPFDHVSKVDVYLPEPAYFTISVYSSNGVLVETLFEGPRLNGDHSFEWNAERHSSGTYLCVLQVGQDRVVNTIVKR